MKLLCIFIAFVLAFVIGQAIVLRTYRFAYRRRLFDPVDSRKIHSGPVPRLGGLMFVPVQCGVFLLVLLAVRPFNIIPISYESLVRFLLLISGMGLLYIVGVIDDLSGVNYKWKFAAQLAAASSFPVSGLWIHNLGGLFGLTVLPSWAGIILTVFLVVFIINACNLIDGIDGLCSGLVMMGCTVLGTLFFVKEMWVHVMFSFVTIGVLSPFFYYNVFGKSRRRRRIFMGDTGSLTLGMSIAFLVISYAVESPDILPVGIGGNILKAFSVVMVPLLDVVRVMVLRLLSGNPLFLPDKRHVHHYLMELGLTRHWVLFYILLSSLLFIVFNVYMVRYMNSNVVLGLDVIFWFVGLWLYGRMKRARNGRMNKNES